MEDIAKPQLVEAQPAAADDACCRLCAPTWKRGLDLAAIVASAPVWLPVCLMVAAVVRLGSRGPILFHQHRVGLGGRVFICYKFRTMHINADPGTHHHHVRGMMSAPVPMTKLDGENDARMIRGASWIRAAGLDELPQIINILRGEMSIVGPRPCIPYEYELYQPWQRHRCDAPPGLTGLWQVSGKNRTTFEEMVRLDIDYARRMSLWLDLKILLLTPVAVMQQVRDLIAARRARKAAKSRPPRSENSKDVDL
jgi:lipopolysaccharide/colanic/teichoic acid biosynthesis glycosyltransferase